MHIFAEDEGVRYHVCVFDQNVRGDVALVPNATDVLDVARPRYKRRRNVAVVSIVHDHIANGDVQQLFLGHRR